MSVEEINQDLQLPLCGQRYERENQSVENE
jgi:hypothetical protein